MTRRAVWYLMLVLVLLLACTGMASAQGDVVELWYMVGLGRAINRRNRGLRHLWRSIRISL